MQHTASMMVWQNGLFVIHYEHFNRNPLLIKIQENSGFYEVLLRLA